MTFTSKTRRPSLKLFGSIQVLSSQKVGSRPSTKSLQPSKRSCTAQIPSGRAGWPPEIKNFTAYTTHYLHRFSLLICNALLCSVLYGLYVVPPASKANASFMIVRLRRRCICRGRRKRGHIHHVIRKYISATLFATFQTSRVRSSAQ